MKRFRPGLFNGIAAVSLVLCVATTALWATSYITSDSFVLCKSRQYSILSNRGFVAVICSTHYVVPFPSGPPFPASERDSYSSTWRISCEIGDSYTDLSNPNFPGLRVGKWSRWGEADLGLEGVESGYQAIAPYWMVTLGLGFVPALWLGQSWRQRGELYHGCCTVCGYDLRATPDRCPECGKAVGKWNGGTRLDKI